MKRGMWSGSLLLGGVGLVMACGSNGGSAFEEPNGASSSGSSGSSGFGDVDGGDNTSSTGASGGPSCATAEAAAIREPVYINIILDGSQSMDGHGATSAGCDTRHAPAPDATVCFLAGARENDPIDTDRTYKVCHSTSQPIGDCPQFRKLTGKKWIAIRGALLEFFDAAKAKADPRFGLGMYLFGSDVQKDADEIDIPIAFVDEAQRVKLRTRILPPNFPTSSGTPLRGSIDEQAKLIRDPGVFTPNAPLEANGKLVFLVITDGAATDGKSEAVELVESLRTGPRPVTTFVIGVGEPSEPNESAYDEKFLSKLANAGGAAPAGCNPDWDGLNPTGKECHFQVTPGTKSATQIKDELNAAMDAIAAKVQSCELTLTKTSPIDPTKVNVVYKSGAGAESQIAKDAANGWKYDNDADPSKVILNGASCTTLKADPAAKVSIVIGCPTGTEVR